MLKQLTIYDALGIPEPLENYQSGSITTDVIEPQTQDKASIPAYSHLNRTKGNVNEYKSSKNQQNYYRYSYRIGKRTKHRHIPGGNAYSSLANHRAELIRQMVNRGASTAEILQQIDSFARK